MLEVSPDGGPDAASPRLGGGGGIADGIRSPGNGGCTPNLDLVSTASFIGVFGGRGGGGGPGFAVFDSARGRERLAALSVLANLPASTRGGGALNLGGGGPRAGEGSRAGDSGAVSNCGVNEGVM